MKRYVCLGCFTISEKNEHCCDIRPNEPAHMESYNGPGKTGTELKNSIYPPYVPDSYDEDDWNYRETHNLGH